MAYVLHSGEQMEGKNVIEKWTNNLQDNVL